MSEELEHAVRLLGPLEGRIMRIVWGGAVTQPFVVRDVLAHMPELAYTTVMTTLRRLADKGLLGAEQIPGQRAHAYCSAMQPAVFLAEASMRETDAMIDRYGDAALAAFAARLGNLTPTQVQRLEELRRQ